jgi:hypothetical protein
MYDPGDGVPQDFATAAKYYRMAAEQGDMNAQFNLAVMYDDGLGVAQDQGEAAHRYRSAAGQGDPQAQFNLGSMYFKGEGVARNEGTALMWLTISAENGEARARTAADHLAASLSGADRALAEERARACRGSDYRACDFE